MLCLPYGEVSSSSKKSITVPFIILLGTAIFYGLNILVVENVKKDPGICFVIIQVLLLLVIVAASIVIYLLKEQCLLRKQLSQQQKVAEDFYIQRDIDTLSGLKNRNSYARLAQQIKKQESKVSVMVCDIDGLKIINDTLGHMAGDLIIQKAAEILQSAFPIGTEIFRIGGDEYLVIIEEGITKLQIISIQDEIAQMISQYNATNPSIPLSMSVGFACSSDDLYVLEDIVKQADCAMYQEKRTCHDKVYRSLSAALRGEYI